MQQSPYDTYTSYHYENRSRLKEILPDLSLSISTAYSSWYKEACGSPNPAYFVRTAVSPFSECLTRAEYHQSKHMDFSSREAIERELQAYEIQAYEDLTWPETYWMRSGDLSL